MKAANIPSSSAVPSSSVGFGIYVHWPFCLSKCPYCDFNSHVAEHVPEDDWRHAMSRALEWFARRTSSLRVGSIFFGGGTPSLMPPALLGAIIDEIARLWPLADDVEITLEANPTSAERTNFSAFAAAGVNRLSLGVQALDDADLVALGRRHTSDDARRAWGLARRFFPRASLDLIYGRPGQTQAAWEAELRDILDWEPEHVAAYQLTMEPGTPFHALHERGRLRLPDENASLALFSTTRAVLDATGLMAYEVSNHARDGAQCRHNLLYWRYGCYAGIGPGAHARLPHGRGGRRALSAIRHPARWLRAALHGQNAGLELDEVLDTRARARECLLMGLRLREGLPLARLAEVAGMTLRVDTIAMLEREGLLHRPATGVVATTSRGELVLDALLAELAGALIPLSEAP